ncbi:sugar phosphate nucleotidyltransferase [soil metagenome]
MKEHTGAIILAAGKGTRMKSKDVNKVALLLGGRPMISYSVRILIGIGVSPIVVVVGFAKESIKKALGDTVLYAEQKKRLGTAHAVMCGLKKLPEDVQNVLVIQGDDSAFYTDKIFEELLSLHRERQASLTLLTIEKDNPTGLGRVYRNDVGEVVAIVEEKDATDEQRKITEINPALYVFSRVFLEKYLPKVKKSPVTGEYYITHLIDIAIANNEALATVKGGKMNWRGVNTPQELQEAENMLAGV